MATYRIAKLEKHIYALKDRLKTLEIEKEQSDDFYYFSDYHKGKCHSKIELLKNEIHILGLILDDEEIE